MERRYVYNHAKCGFCSSAVATWDMSSRTVYACLTCQPLLDGTQLSPLRSQALRIATPTKACYFLSP